MIVCKKVIKKRVWKEKKKKNGAASFVCGHPRPSILKEKDYWAPNNKGFYVQGV